MQPNKKIKITYILFGLNKAFAFEWKAEHLDKEKFDLSFISIHVEANSLFEQFCRKKNIEFHRVEYQSKRNMLTAIFQTYRLLRKIKPVIVHCHIFEGSLIGLTAAWLAGIEHRITTRHHSSFHHIHAPGGVKYDLFCNKIATTIVAPSENVRKILIEREGVPANKITLIHHGFDLSHFQHVSPERMTVVQEKYNPENKHPVIGIVSRYTKLKGIPYIINAFKSVQQQFPSAYLILANAKGEDKPLIQDLLQLLPAGSYCEIEFEPDNGALFKLFDLFVHTPIDRESEAFGQTYIEALSAGIPCIFTLSGIACEFVEHQKNAWVVDYENSEHIQYAMFQILKDKDFAKDLIENGRKDIENYFSLPLMIATLEQLYENQA